MLTNSSNENQPNRERFEQRIVALDDQVEQLTDGFAEKQNAEAEIRLHSQPLPKLSDITTFREELIQVLDDPEIQKTAISGLIDEVTDYPTAALYMQRSFSTQ